MDNFDDKRIILTSDASNLTYPSNTITSFRCQLPIELVLDYSTKVAVTMMIFPTDGKDIATNKNNKLTNNNERQIYVYSDIVEPTIFGENYQPILAICNYNKKGYFSPPGPMYVETKGGRYNSIKIWITNHLGEAYKFKKGKIILCLNFENIND